MLQCHPREVMLRQVHGYAQLHVPKAKDVGAMWVIRATSSFKVAYACELASSELVPTLVKSSRGDSLGDTDATTIGPDVARPKEQGGGQETTLGIANVPRHMKVSGEGGTSAKCKGILAIEQGKRVPHLGKVQ